MRTCPVGGTLRPINRSLKLALDVPLGAVAPILVLSYLSDPLGPVPAYLLSALIPVGWGLAAPFFFSRGSTSTPARPPPPYPPPPLIPVGWVLADLFFLSRRFNFITAFLGLNAIVRGLLAFLFVDGALYALKDTVGSILIVVVLGGSLVWGPPLPGAFAAPALAPPPPA